MKDAILVLNAGSSSVKFSVFVVQGKTLELQLRGQLESLFTSPRFTAKDPKGKVVAEKSWGEGVKLGHEGALANQINREMIELPFHAGQRDALL